MKKYIFPTLLSVVCFLSFFFASIFPVGAIPVFPKTLSASADDLPNAGDYACVLTNDAYFYTDKHERCALFLLPESYYVKLLEYAPEYCKIEYQTDDTNRKKLIGYAKTEHLTFVNYLPKRPYLSYVFEVDYYIEDPKIEDDSFLNKITLSCFYYGDYVVGNATYCYVLQNGSFGYVPKPDDLYYERNLEYEEFLSASKPTPDEPSSSSTSTESTSSPAQLAILVALCLLVPILSALILKQPKRPIFESEE